MFGESLQYAAASPRVSSRHLAIVSFSGIFYNQDRQWCQRYSMSQKAKKGAINSPFKKWETKKVGVPPERSEDDAENFTQRKPLTPKQRIKLFSPAFGLWIHELSRQSSRSTGSTESEDPKIDLLAGNILEKLSRSVVLAAEQLGLETEDPKDRLWLLGILAWGFYGGKSGGRPKKWNEEKYSQLLADIKEKKEKNPELDEFSLCKEVIKDRSKLDRYDKATGKTLLRQLQEAKLRESRDAKAARILTELTK